MNSKRIILTVLLTLFLVAQVSVVFASDNNCDNSPAEEETSVSSEETDIKAIERAIEDAGASWTAGKTSVSKLSPDDRRRLCGLKGFPEAKDEIITEDASHIGDYPVSFDWRNHEGGDWTTGIKDQLACGSCWAFGSLAAMEAQYNIEEGDADIDIDLSEQAMVSCSPGSCGGWFLHSTMNWLRDTGTVDEACFPYIGWDAPCNLCTGWEDRVWTIDDWGYVPISMDAIKAHLLEAPLPAGLTVYTDFYYYDEGVYEHEWGSYEGGHLITIVGWNDADLCWICKNSWNTDWGEDGWFRIRYGECDVGYEAVYITDVLPPGSTPTISITTDSGVYAPGDTMTATTTIDNPTTDFVTLKQYVGVPQFSYWVLVTEQPISPGYSGSTDESITIGNWGAEPFDMMWVAGLCDFGTGEVITWDTATCTYAPGPPGMNNIQTADITERIDESIRKAEQ